MKLTHVIIQISEHDKACEVVCKLGGEVIHIDVDTKAHAKWYVDYWTQERIEELSRMLNKTVKLNKF